MKSLGEKVKGAGKFIAKTAKFFTTFIGQIVFFLLCVLLIGLLAYIVFMVISKDLAKLIGIDAAAAQSNKSNYEIQMRLANSGYDSVLNAEELVEYYGFEYAVLMDAVRFIEDTGVSEIPIINISPVDCNTIDREQWAWLNAVQFQDQTDKEALIYAGFLNEDGTRKDGGPMATNMGDSSDLASAGQDLNIVGGNTVNGELAGTGDPFEAPLSKPGEGKIIYEGVMNEYTGETVLTPYLTVTRKWLDYGYFLEDKQWAGGDSELVVKALGKKNRYGLPGGYDESGADLFGGFEYIYTNIFALMIKDELNLYNKSAYPKGKYTSSSLQDAMEGATSDDGESSRYESEAEQAALQNSSESNTVGAGQVSSAEEITGNGENALDGKIQEVDLYKIYEDNLWYTVGDKGTRKYKIPFRALLDRFLPNANLMASWRQLSDETADGDKIEIVKEIQQIYSKACLEGEEGGPEPADMSNTASFAVMGVAKVESNLFRHWKVTKEERYVFADAFEGVALGKKDDEIRGTVTFSWKEKRKISDVSGGSRTRYYAVLNDFTEIEITEEQYEREKVEYMILGHHKPKKVTVEEEVDGPVYPIRSGDYYVTVTVSESRDLDDILKAERISYNQAATQLFWNYLSQEARDEGMGDWFYCSTVLVPYPTEEDRFIEDTTGKKLVKTAPGEEYTNRTGETLLAGEMAVVRENEGTTASREYDTSIPGTAEPGGEGSETVQTEFNIITLKDMNFSSTHDPVNLNTELLKDLIYKKIDKLPRYSSKNGLKISLSMPEPDFYAVFPVEKKEIAYTQSVWAKSLPFYVTTGAKMWSAKKQFTHTIIESGTFDDPNNYHFLIHCNDYAKGYVDYKCRMKADWRCELFAPVFASKEDEAKTKARESDVLVLLSEWEEAADSGIGAADYFIRDLRSLLLYSKGVEEGRDGGSTSPVTSDIHPGSYEYLYIKDEIIEFDEALADPIFWTNRLFASTGDDEIDEETENKMKSRMVTKMWQNVDYALYDECKTGNGSYAVYALWPFGSQYSGLLYAMAANSSEKENLKIFREQAAGWGGYSRAHKANDLYGRRLSAEICETAFMGGTEALIKAKYENGKTTLSGTNSTGGLGLYFDDVFVRLTLDGTRYSFNGTQAAVYGYALYTKTAQLKDGKKAEAEIRKELEKEVHWTRINAIAPGIVISSGANTSAGFFVNVLHADGSKSFYCHMKRYPEVQIGEYVGAGTLLGYEGTTGRSSGYHLHNEIAKGGERLNPTRYYYPFFTPFYYEEKAKEANMSLSSEYMSYERTIFPYQQLAWDHSGLWETGGSNVEILNDHVVIKNYTPTLALVDDVSQLLTKEDERYVDYSKLPTENVTTSLGGESYGRILETSSCYFDEDYIRAVVGRASGDSLSSVKIKGSGDSKNESEEPVRPGEDRLEET